MEDVFLIIYLFYLICIELFRVSSSYWMNFHSLSFSRNVSLCLKFICFKYSFIAAESVCILCFIPDEKCINSPFIFVSLLVFINFLIISKSQHFISLFLLLSFCSWFHWFFSPDIYPFFYLLWVYFNW